MSKLLLILTTFLCANEIHFISYFDIYHLPIRSLENTYTIKNVKPVDYLKKPVYLDENVKKVIVLSDEKHLDDVLPLIPKEKLVLFILEPGESSATDPLFAPYAQVYTWDNRLIDNSKFFRLNFPFLKPMIKNPIPFHKREFAAMVVGNWTQERTDIYNFFQKNAPSLLHCYGRIIPPNLKVKRTYKGPIPGFYAGPDKISCLSKYKFCICFENCADRPGYVTEKILCCFTAGCIPVYLGAPDVTKHIPASCFIDYRNFNSDLELLNYLQTMTAEEHEQYLENIKSFIRSDMGRAFTPKEFEKTMRTLIER